MMSLLSLVLVIGSFHLTGAFMCYSCTYLFAGHDGTAGYECVNDTTAFPNTRELSCDLPKKCVVQSVYEQGYARLLSMTKDCMEPTMDSQCESPEFIRPVCFRECSTDYCNDIDGNFVDPINLFPSSGVLHTSYVSASVGISMFLMTQIL